MSENKALEFIRLMETDPAIQRKLEGSIDMNTLRKVAAEAGYEFSPEGWQAAVKTALERQDELSEEDLEHVAGGLNPQPLPPKYLNSFIKINPVLTSGIIIVGGYNR